MVVKESQRIFFYVAHHFVFREGRDFTVTPALNVKANTLEVHYQVAELLTDPPPCFPLLKSICKQKNRRMKQTKDKTNEEV